MSAHRRGIRDPREWRRRLAGIGNQAVVGGSGCEIESSRRFLQCRIH